MITGEQLEQANEFYKRMVDSIHQFLREQTREGLEALCLALMLQPPSSKK